MAAGRLVAIGLVASANPQEGRLSDKRRGTDVRKENPQGATEPGGPAGEEAVAASGQDGDDRRVGRRMLLRGGMVAGALGVGGLAGSTMAATPASAATSDPVLQGETNNVGTNQAATEITTANSSPAAPALILTNTGSPGTNEASPVLRLTPAVSDLYNPASKPAGGDMFATYDGNLWFTHDVPGYTGGPFAAPVHTDANSNSFAPLAAPVRILDTRPSVTGGKAHVIDKTGKFDSHGRLIAGKTIHINLTSLVYFGDAVTANLTAVRPTSNGYMTIWSGIGSVPTASSINFVTGQVIANLAMVGIADYTTSGGTYISDTVAIYAHSTTHVLLDVSGFSVGDFAQVLGPLGATAKGSARAERARQALAKLRS